MAWMKLLSCNDYMKVQGKYIVTNITLWAHTFNRNLVIKGEFSFCLYGQQGFYS